VEFYVILRKMTNAPAYIAARFLQRFIGFFVHWYVGGTRIFWTSTLRVLNELENLFGRPVGGSPINLINWGLRVLWGGVVCTLVVFAALVIYTCWFLLPPYALFRALDAIL